MPREIGLGDTVLEQDIDGDVDFDFFDQGRSQEGTRDLNELTNDGANVIPIEDVASRPLTDGDGNANLNAMLLPFHGFRGSSFETEFDLTNLLNLTSELSVTKDKTSVPRVLTLAASSDNKESPKSGTKDCRPILPSSETWSSENRENEVGATMAEAEDESDASLDVTVSESSSSLSDDSLDQLSDSDDMTDVTPLSSANNSPLPSSPNRFLMKNPPPRSPYQMHRKETVTFVDETRFRNQASDLVSKRSTDDREKEIDLQMLVQAILNMEQQQQKLNGKRSECLISGQLKKNMSFSNDDVRRIDRENQLLLKKILDRQHCRRAAAESQLSGRSSKLASSAINRYRQQKRIEAENLLLLKRIQSAKPTKELSRNYLLKSAQSQNHSMSMMRPSSQTSTARSARSSEVSPPQTSTRASSRSHSASSTTAKTTSARDIIGAFKTVNAKSQSVDRWLAKM